jgi:GT2 family glycosyltransferase
MAVDLAQLASANQFTNNALVFRRAAFTEVGGFREDLPLLYDWDFNVRLAVRFRIECLPMNLANYHLRAAQDGAPNSAQDEMLRAAAKIRNEWIRADLAAGRIGLGQLALAGEAVGVGRFLARMARWRMRLRHWLA